MEQGPEDCSSLIPHMYWVLRLAYEPNMPTSTRLIVLFQPPTLHHFRMVVLNFPTSGLTHASRQAWRQSWWQKENKKTLENWSATKPCTPTHIIQCLKPRKRSLWIDGISNYTAKMMWNRAACNIDKASRNQHSARFFSKSICKFCQYWVKHLLQFANSHGKPDLTIQTQHRLCKTLLLLCDNAATAASALGTQLIFIPSIFHQ